MKLERLLVGPGRLSYKLRSFVDETTKIIVVSPECLSKFAYIIRIKSCTAMEIFERPRTRNLMAVYRLS